MSKIEDVFIAAPCRYGWQNMSDTGEAKSRFCDGCEMPVYDLSTMTRDEINHLLNREGDSVCLRLMRDEAGEIVSRETRLGFFLRHRLHTIFVSFIAFFLAIPLALAKGSQKDSTVGLDSSFWKYKKMGIDLRYLDRPRDMMIFDGRPCVIQKQYSSTTTANSNPNSNAKSSSRASRVGPDDNVAISPSWLAKLSDSKEMSAQEAIDIRVFQLYREARESLNMGQCSMSLSLLEDALELAEKSRHDPKFVEFLRREYDKQQAIHKTDPNHFHGYIEGRSLRQPNIAPPLPEGAPFSQNRKKD